MDIVNRLSKLLGNKASLVAGSSFRWSPQDQQIVYDQQLISTPRGKWSLFHEAGHSLLDHTTYNLDIELLYMEVAAWDKAKFLAAKLDVVIDEDHIQDCLDTYRSWLHRRSKCPVCDTNGIQKDAKLYICLNCKARWAVSNSRFCRPYRQTKRLQKTTG